MSTLAIRGHETRGNEVIELLEMLGGHQCGYSKEAKDAYWFIDRCNNIVAYSHAPTDLYDEFIIFTLEEFLEKFPYKVGDNVVVKERDKIVTITDMSWRNDREVIYETLFKDDCYECFSAEELQPYKEQEPMEEQKLIPPYMDYDVRTSKMNPAEMDGERFIVPIPKGYEFVGVDNQQVVFEKVKPQYPKNYEECCDILQLVSKFILPELNITEEITIKPFIQLKRCRDAYWKLAGDWEPDWSTEDEIKYVIEVYRNNVRTNTQGYSNTILAFPTAEMRDAFYDNFRELIEKCKELL